MIRSKIIRNTFYVQLVAYILSSLTRTIGGMIDGVIIGQFLGVDSMAAFGIISPLMVGFALTGSIVASGSRYRYTMLIGEGQIKKAQGIYTLSVIVSVGIAALLMLIIIPLAGPIASLLGASGNAADLLPKAKDYLIGIAIGLPAINGMHILNNYMAIDNDVQLPVIASMVLTATDIILDIIVAFVIHGDTFEMGLATSISYTMAVLVLLLHFRKKNIILHFTPKNIDWKELGGIITKGLPVGVFRVGFTIRSAFMNGLLAAIASSSAIAAYSVYQQADEFLCCLTIGMGEAVATLAGVLLGEEDRPGMKRLLFISIQATLVITLGTACITFGAAPLFVSLFIRNAPEAFVMSVRAVRAYAIGMPLYGMSLIYFNYFQGIGKSRLSSITGFLSESGFLMLSAGILSRFIGADAIWFAFPTTQLMMYILYTFIIAWHSKKLQISKMSVVDKILLLPGDFDVSKEEYLDVSISDRSEVVSLSDSAWNFCKEHGCDKRRTYLMSLCVEELTKNIFTYGFSYDKRKHSIDMRIIHKGEDYILRVRDDCYIFDPVNQLTLYSDEDLKHHMGLRMTIGEAKEVHYASILKMNNLLIRV